MHTGLWCGDLKERDRLGDLCVDGMVILKWIFNKWYGKTWTGVARGQGQVAGCRGCGNEPLGSIKWGDFVTSEGTISS